MLNLLMYRRRHRGQGAASGAPIVASQSMPFGRKTSIGDGLSGFGDGALISTGGTPTSLTLGTRTVGSDHFEVDGPGLKPKAVPTDPQYVYTGCVASNAEGDSDPFTLTINTIAFGFSVFDIGELRTVLESASTSYGDTVYLRSGYYSDGDYQIDPATFTGSLTRHFNKADSNQGRDLTTGNHVKVTPHSGAVSIIGRMQLRDTTSAQGGIRFTGGIIFERTSSTTVANPQVNGVIAISGLLSDITIDGCTIRSTIASFPNEEARYTGIVISGATPYLTIQSNLIQDTDNGITQYAPSADQVIYDNTFQRQWGDTLFWSYGAKNLLIAWNRFFDKLHRTSGGNHPDIVQLAALGADEDVDNVRIIGNLVYRGIGQPGQFDGQVFFLKDNPVLLDYDAKTVDFSTGQVVTGEISGAYGQIATQGTNRLRLYTMSETPFQYNEIITDPLGGSATTNIPSGVIKIKVTNCVIRGNLIMNTLVNCIYIEDAVGAIVEYNTVLRDLDNKLNDWPASVVLTQESDSNFVRHNIAEAYVLSADPNVTDENNTTLTQSEAAYSAEFEDPQYGKNIIDIKAHFRVKAGSASNNASPKRGAHQDIVDFDAQTINIPSAYSAHAVHFDGTNDYLARGGDLTGAVDGQKITISFRFKWGDASGPTIFGGIYGSLGNASSIYLTNTDRIQIVLKNTSWGTSLSVTSDVIANLDEWHHCMASFDMSDNTKKHLYIDDVSSYNETTFAVGDTLQLAINDHWFGALNGGGYRWFGDQCDPAIWFGRYTDFSIEAERLKFYGADGKPVDLGVDGELPFGVGNEPIMLFNNSATTGWETNKGSGGGFTENGALADASSSPSD